jgi:hypothetical protein
MHAVVAVSILLAAATSDVTAQRSRDRHVVDGGRVALIAPAPAPVVVVAPRHGFYGSPYAYQYGHAPYGYFPNAAIMQNIPVVMLHDGRVFANFGYGYEQVVRTCAPAGVAPLVTGYANVTTGAIVQPTVVQPVITQPAPAQQTASEQMLARALSPATVVTTIPGPLAAQVVTASCWSNYGSSVYVFRR